MKRLKKNDINRDVLIKNHFCYNRNLCYENFQTLVFVNKCTLVPVATPKVQNLILRLSNELLYYGNYKYMKLDWYTKIFVLETSIMLNQNFKTLGLMR